MESAIKNYLHLYLGCEVLFEEVSYYFVHTLHIYKGDILKLNTGTLFNISIGSGIIIKPILRPLSDMTEEEQRELLATHTGEALHDLKHIVVRRDWFDAQYLLSKHFDLFGLIESGLAIDKTKLSKL